MKCLGKMIKIDLLVNLNDYIVFNRHQGGAQSIECYSPWTVPDLSLGVAKET
jgi:hypothetical protein